MWLFSLLLWKKTAYIQGSGHLHRRKKSWQQPNNLSLPKAEWVFKHLCSFILIYITLLPTFSAWSQTCCNMLTGFATRFGFLIYVHIYWEPNINPVSSMAIPMCNVFVDYQYTWWCEAWGPIIIGEIDEIIHQHPAILFRWYNIGYSLQLKRQAQAHLYVGIPLTRHTHFSAKFNWWQELNVTPWHSQFSTHGKFTVRDQKNNSKPS